MKSRTRILAALGAMLTFSFLNISASPVSAQIVVDNFTSTQGGGDVFLFDPGTSSSSETGLAPGSVIGGASTVRGTSITRLSGGVAAAGILPGLGVATAGVGNASTGTFSLNYSDPGGLSADLSGFLGISIDVAGFDDGIDSVPMPVTVTLTDGNAVSAPAVGAISGTGELIIPPGAFAGLGALDLSDIDNISVVFSLLDAQEITINSIVALTPEPVTVLLWSFGALGFALFWRRYGTRIRKAE